MCASYAQILICYFLNKKQAYDDIHVRFIKRSGIKEHATSDFSDVACSLILLNRLRLV